MWQELTLQAAQAVLLVKPRQTRTIGIPLGLLLRVSQHNFCWLKTPILRGGFSGTGNCILRTIPVTLTGKQGT